MSRNGNRRVWIAALAAACGAAASAADFKDLLGRVPGDANAIVVVDIERILKSPVAAREKWAERMADAYADRPLIVPPETSKVVMAALLDPRTFESTWEVSVLDLAQPRKVDSIAKAERGYVDKLGDKLAAWSPINAYFVQLDERLLGAVTPANRQFAARWARQKHTVGGAFVSMYLRSAVAAVDADTDIVFAVDLEDVTSLPKVQHTLHTRTFKALEGKNVDPNVLAPLVAGIKGVTLKIDIGEKIIAKGTVDFGSDTAPLKDVGRDLLLEILSEAGAYLPDFEQWEFTARGKSIALAGELSGEGLRRILSVIQPPAPQTVAPAAVTPGPKSAPGQPPVEKPAPASEGELRTKASQGYFRAVTKMIETLQKDIGSGAKSTSLAQAAAWMRRDAKRIDKLPILNVDPDLLEWGAEMSARLSDAANVFAVGGITTRQRTTSVENEYEDYGGYDDSGDYENRASTGLANRDKQRQAAALEEKANALQAAAKIFDGIKFATSKVRAAMTERYKVEF